MKRLLKWVGIVSLGLIVVIIVLVFGLSAVGARQLSKTRDVQVVQVMIPRDEIALARGQKWVQSLCTSCHGPDLSGAPLIDEPGLATVYAANLTLLNETRSDEDLVRAIRHGLGPDGRQLIGMPSDIFIHFSEQDLGAVIAFLRTLEPIGEQQPAPAFALPGRIVLATGIIGEPFPAEYTEHTLPLPMMPDIGANAEYGAYLAGFCTACHGSDLGGAQPVFDPAVSYAPNLTAGGALGEWTQGDFLTAMRTGVTPDGRQINPAFMPWVEFGRLDDEELLGLWTHLTSLPPVVHTER